jgi:hypothetical protein
MSVSGLLSAKMDKVESRMTSRQRFIYVGVILLLTVCIWGHVSEFFDHWDDTFQTANDIESYAVIVALVAGTAFGVRHIYRKALRRVSADFLPQLLVTIFPTPRTPFLFVVFSPPPPLRI